jgi:CheY-like chemotaxis protein
MSGFEVEEQLRNSPQPMPVIIITGHDTPEAQRRALAAGAAAYLRKPSTTKCCSMPSRARLPAREGAPAP